MKKKGFTLVELISVIGLLAIVSLLLVPAFTKISAEMKESTCEDNMFNIVQMYQVYVDENPNVSRTDQNSFEVFQSLFATNIQCPEGGEYYVENGMLKCTIHDHELPINLPARDNSAPTPDPTIAPTVTPTAAPTQTPVPTPTATPADELHSITATEFIQFVKSRKTYYANKDLRFYGGNTVWVYTTWQDNQSITYYFTSDYGGTHVFYVVYETRSDAYNIYRHGRRYIIGQTYDY